MHVYIQYVYYSVILYDSTHCLQCTMLGNSTQWCKLPVVYVTFFYFTVYNTSHYAACPTIKYNSRWFQHTLWGVNKHDFDLNLFTTILEPSWKYLGLYILPSSFSFCNLRVFYQDALAGGSVCVFVSVEKSPESAWGVQESMDDSPLHMRKPLACTGLTYPTADTPLITSLKAEWLTESQRDANVQRLLRIIKLCVRFPWGLWSNIQFRIDSRMCAKKPNQATHVQF